MTQALVPLPSVWNLLAWTGIGVAWIGLLTLHSVAHHPNGLILFLEWQLMLIAMMLPSALPVFRLLMQLTPRLIDRIAFVFPYWLIWSSFAVFLWWQPLIHNAHSLKFIHAAFPSSWQEIVLIGTGIFQFTPSSKLVWKGVVPQSQCC